MVFDLIVLEAFSNEEIAAALNIKTRTAKYHTSEILKAFELRDRLQLTVMYWRTLFDGDASTKTRRLANFEKKARSIPRATRTTPRREKTRRKASALVTFEREYWPTGWSARRTKRGYSMRGPRKRQRMIIDARQTPRGRATDRDLLAMAKKALPDQAALIPKRYAQFVGYASEEIDGARLTRRWWLRKANLLVMIVYETTRTVDDLVAVGTILRSMSQVSED